MLALDRICAKRSEILRDNVGLQFLRSANMPQGDLSIKGKSLKPAI
jgi:hypothetical protein